jgi:hypothetical protein
MQLRKPLTRVPGLRLFQRRRGRSTGGPSSSEDWLGAAEGRGEFRRGSSEESTNGDLSVTFGTPSPCARIDSHGAEFTTVFRFRAEWRFWRQRLVAMPSPNQPELTPARQCRVGRAPHNGSTGPAFRAIQVNTQSSSRRLANCADHEDARFGFSGRAERDIERRSQTQRREWFGLFLCASF